MDRQTFIIFHILAIIVVVGSMITGLRIALISQDWLSPISTLLPQGQMHIWHLGFGIALSLIIASYLLHSFTSPFRSIQSKYHKIINYLGYFSLPLVSVSGWLIWAGLYSDVSRTIHQIAMWAMCIYLVFHAWIYIVQNGRRVFSILLPKRAALRHLSFIFGLCAISLSSLFLVKNTTHQLNVLTIDDATFIEIDGKADELAWKKASPISIMTIGGANFNQGATKVTVKALANKYESYFLISWQDETKSTNHLPLFKTAQGWKVQENGFYNFDERTFYEDKFAVMLSDGCEIAGDKTLHLGDKPINDKPKNWHGKGYHASLDGKTRDLWHWKAVRTNDMYLADDNFIGPPAPHLSGKRRYTAGYQADGKESGAYVMNWQWYTPNSVIPKRLPSNLDVDQQHRNGVLPWFGSSPYRESDDLYPPGTFLSSVLYRSNRFEGDRADVRARGEWKNGQWTLELVRKHNTQSKYDVALQTGTCMWVSAFDHSQIAHTRHMQAIKLRYAL
ncbi:ethylbenzene dehydrogenase-related protein [Pseudoalteromonas luteoviolacea]|uniref:Cytochrome c-552/DMSO reductase-like haem-binding domain-containing protein n=1 Tax=Pseudoalteromonas luteoviolacea NCIMB 1942 TaxID=1365253 RepID=A0A166Z7K7_9GAMM|nr:ethylbenzene dehydrogenase-related protein [Pseudoalteromonas luteoviolacea]KZN44022.1 hypothetical protein N482_17905 [Pseudoalteromonas luteoviolacea NCIMB 1942]